MHQKYEHLQKTINGENDIIIDDMHEIVGLVQKEHHEEEVKTRDSDLDTMGKNSKSAVIKKNLR